MPIIKKEKGFFGKLSERIGDVLMQRSTVDEEMLDELEEVLITSDIGMDTTMRIMEDVRDHVKINHITRPEQVKDAIVNVITYMVDKGGRNKLSDKTPLVILMIGINGGGKTTSIAKLGNLLKTRAGASCSPPRIHSVPPRANNLRSGETASEHPSSCTEKEPILPLSSLTRSGRQRQKTPTSL